LSNRWLLPDESILLTDAFSALVFLLEVHFQTSHHREWSVGNSDRYLFSAVPSLTVGLVTEKIRNKYLSWCWNRSHNPAW